jgi:hypothetical protein
LHEIGFVELITDVHEECKWVAEERPPEEIPLPLFSEEETDDETEICNVTGRSNNRWRDAWIRTREVCLDREKDIEGADVCGDCNLVYCTCIGEIPLSEEEGNDAVIEAQKCGGNGDNQSDDISDDQDGNEDDDNEGGEAYDSDGYLIPPTSCIKGHGEMGATNTHCSFCGGFGFGPDQEEDAYADDDSDHEDPLEEDDEHFDSEERIGMLFHTWEPGILLACKEIREQCLPLYYGSNAFSWRFFWGHQANSLACFTEWTQVVGKNAKYITQISFEGRHSIEEGIEFEVDIDLLEESPFFDIAADCIHPGDELTDVIVEVIEQDFVTVLWRMSKRDRGVIKISSKDLCLLGTIFSEALQRDPGMAGDRGQWDGKHAGAPRHT